MRTFRVTEAMRSRNRRKAARGYIEAGLKIVLLHGIRRDGTCTCGKTSCGSPGKHPVSRFFPHGVKDATRNLTLVERVFEAVPKANIAIALDGLTVVDIDGERGRKVVAEAGLPAASKVLTNRGEHLYFTGEFSEGSFKGEQLDVLTGSARYATVPPSYHSLGKRYRWALTGPRIAPRVPLVLGRLRADKLTKRKARVRRGSIASGSRNDVLFRMACYLRYRGFSEQTVEAVIRQVNEVECALPLDEDEVERVVASSGRYGHEDLFAPVGDAEPLPLEALWYPYIMKHAVTILAGDPGRGKSLLVSSLVATITTGGRWPLSDARAKKGPVILLSAEDNFERVTLPRLIHAGADTDLVHRMMKFRSLTPERLADLADYVRKVRPELIVIDTLSAYLGGDRDMNRQNEVGEFIAMLNEIAEETGCAVLALAHLNKQTNEHALFRIVGSIGIAASVRSALFLGSDPNDRSRLALAHGKANGTLLGPTLTIEKVGGGEGKVPTLKVMEAIDADANAVCQVDRRERGRPTTESEAAEEHILQSLAAEEPREWSSVVQSAEARGIASESTLSNVRASLAKEGVIVQVGKGRAAKWKLSSRGRDRKKST